MPAAIMDAPFLDNWEVWLCQARESTVLEKPVLEKLCQARESTVLEKPVLEKPGDDRMAAIEMMILLGDSL